MAYSKNKKIQIETEKILKNSSKSYDQALLDAKESVHIQEVAKEMDIESMFIYAEEKRYAKKLIFKYLEDYTIETVSDKNTLAQLIFLEVTQQRLQKVINETYSDTKSVPRDALDSIHKNTDKIISLKNTLGITRTKQDSQVKDAFSYLQMLKRKRKRWLSENQASRYLTCPHCSKSILLKIKTDVWDAQKHPFFRDRILGNEHLLTLYKEQKLSREDLAKVFDTSLDYIDWLVDRGWGLSSIVESKDKKQLSQDSSINNDIKEEQQSKNISN